MSEMKCFGYYWIKPMKKPDWCTLKTEKILSVSENGLSDKFPDLTKCFWINYPQSDRDEYSHFLGLSKAEFSEFAELVTTLFQEKRLTADARFSYFEDAQSIGYYLRNVSGFRLVGLYTDSELFSEFENEGYFKTVKAGNVCNKGKRIGSEILGSECIQDGYFVFNSYMINSLNEELSEKVNLKIDNKTGLILNDFEDVKRFADMIEGLGEDEIWSAFELYEYG